MGMKISVEQAAVHFRRNFSMDKGPEDAGSRWQRDFVISGELACQQQGLSLEIIRKSLAPESCSRTISETNVPRNGWTGG